MLILLFYHSIFNTYTGQKIVNIALNSFLQGKLSFSTHQFSLFYGFEFRNIEIIPKGDNQPLFKASRLALLYNLPALFRGNLQVQEIALEKPYIYIENKENQWNFDRLLIPSQPTPETPSTPSPDEVGTGISIGASLKLKIEDLHFLYKQEVKGQKLDAEIKDVTLKISADTYKTKTIPLTLKALQLIQHLSIELNPNKKNFIFFSDGIHSISHNFDLFLSLFKSESQKPMELVSKLNIGSENIPILIKDKKIPNFGFFLGYELKYIPEKDSVVLDYLKLIFNKDVWLDISGALGDVTKDNITLKLSNKTSNIHLKPVSDILQYIPAVPKMSLSGIVALAPLEVSGNLKEIRANAQLNANGIKYISGKDVHSVDYLKLKLKGLFDLDTKAKPTAAQPLPNIKELTIDLLDVSYNTILASLKGNISSKEGLNVSLDLKRLDIHTLVNSLYGVISANLKVKGNDFSNIAAELNGNFSSFRYTVDKAKSGLSYISAYLKGNLVFTGPFSLDTIPVEKLYISLKNQDSKENEKAFMLSLEQSKLYLSNEFGLQIKKLNLSSNLKQSLTTFPINLRDTISLVRQSIGNNPSIQGSVSYFNKKEKQDISGDLTFSLPALNLYDLNTKLGVYLHKNPQETIEISNFQIKALNSNLNGSIFGKLEKGKKGVKAPLADYFPNLDIDISLYSGGLSELVQNLSFQGDIAFKATIKDFIAKGFLISPNANLEFRQGTCLRANDCKIFKLLGLELNIPFQHNLGMQSTPSLIQGDISKYSKTYGQTLPGYIKIKNIVAPHPSKPEISIDYIKETGGLPGLSGKIDYKENYLVLDNLKVFLLDGTVYGKDILFNVGNGNIETMEYATTLQIKDIDLKTLLPPEKRNNFDDGKIKADINILGNNLKDPLNNLNLFFSIYQIGKDFGKSAINIISPQNLLTDWIIGSYSIDKLDLQLNRGLIYTTILFKRSILSSLLAKIENNKITQERIPLANFLNRAKSEISTYQ